MLVLDLLLLGISFYQAGFLPIFIKEVNIVIAPAISSQARNLNFTFVDPSNLQKQLSDTWSSREQLDSIIYIILSLVSKYRKEGHFFLKKEDKNKYTGFYPFYLLTITQYKVYEIIYGPFECQFKKYY